MSLQEWFYIIGIVFFFFVGSITIALIVGAYYAWKKIQALEQEMKEKLGPVADIVNIVRRPSIIAPSSMALTVLPLAWKYGRKLWRRRHA